MLKQEGAPGELEPRWMDCGVLLLFPCRLWALSGEAVGDLLLEKGQQFVKKGNVLGVCKTLSAS